MSFTEKLQRENLESLKGQLNYSIDCLSNRINEMEDWEVKEYLQVHKSTQSEYVSLYNHIQNVF